MVEEAKLALETAKSALDTFLTTGEHAEFITQVSQTTRTIQRAKTMLATAEAELVELKKNGGFATAYDQLQILTNTVNEATAAYTAAGGAVEAVKATKVLRVKSAGNVAVKDEPREGSDLRAAWVAAKAGSDWKTVMAEFVTAGGQWPSNLKRGLVKYGIDLAGIEGYGK